MGYVPKYYRNHNLFLVCVISRRGKQKNPKCTSDAHFRVCLHVFTNNFQRQTTKACSVRFFSLENLQCLLFQTTKVCSVRFFITKFVVSHLAMFKYNATANLSSKPILLHPSNPCRFLRGKLMG
jgi:hypothetical protein